MIKDTYTFELQSDDRFITYSAEGLHNVSDVLEHFMLFMRGCGFCFELEDELVVDNPHSSIPTSIED